MSRPLDVWVPVHLSSKQHVHLSKVDRAATAYKTTLKARFMGPTWGHLGPTGPRWAPCWPHEIYYLGKDTPFYYFMLNCYQIKIIRSIVYCHYYSISKIAVAWNTNRKYKGLLNVSTMRTGRNVLYFYSHLCEVRNWTSNSRPSVFKLWQW